MHQKMYMRSAYNSNGSNGCDSYYNNHSSGRGAGTQCNTNVEYEAEVMNHSYIKLC
jgi:hypothetical protein